MKRLFLLGLLALSTLGYSQSLSPQSEISLLTISPGNELWSFAGHTAMRIKDPANGIDVNFNYGVFDFRAESFYLRFLRGTLPYQIGAYNSIDELNYWISVEQRGVIAQKLNLSLSQKQAIFDFLKENYEPENREYNYKFFYDNCSSRFRDVVQTTLNDSIQFSKTLNSDKSYRDWIHVFSDSCKNDWAKFGMDLLIGIPADEKTGASGAMYIPDNLREGFDSARVYSQGTWKPLVERTYVLSDNRIPFKSLPVKPFFFFSVLFLVVSVLSFQERRTNHRKLWLDRIIFTITGLVGFILLLLWFFTNHGVTSNNLNILWAFPLVLPGVWLISNKKSTGKAITVLFFCQMLMALVVLIGFSLLPQQFSPSVIPIASIVLLRSFMIWKKLG